MLDKNSMLIFVYNANSDLFSAATDFMKKILTPDSYSCNLCAVTYGSVSMKSPWKNYIDTIPNEKRFLHKDEFLKEFPNYNSIELPTILTKDEEDIKIFLSAKEINKTKNLSDMITLMKEKIDS